MRYILNEEYKLCGWSNCPFAVMNTKLNESLPVHKHIFELLFKCSGKKDIDIDLLSDSDKKVFDSLLKENVIHEAEDGEKRTLAYFEYPCVYKGMAHWSITGRCNYRCKHCFQSAPHGVLGEPTLEQCLDVVRQMEECGIRKVGITGGEPLIRKDFFVIVDALIKAGINISVIYSNGKLVTDEFLDEIEKRNIHPSFQISFDGVGFHDWMRGVEGAEEIALDAFMRLKKRGFSATSSMCLCRENISSIRETVLKLKEVGCLSLKFQCSMPMGEWADQKEHFLTYDETLQAYLDYLPLYKEDGMPINIQMEGFFMYQKGRGYLNLSDKKGKEENLGSMPPCGVIQNAVYIGPGGTVAPCMSMDGCAIGDQLPNIFETPLKDILSKSDYMKLTGYHVKDVFDHNEKCRTCKYRTKCCAGCRALAVGSEGTDYLAIDPITCKILTEGWADKLDEVAGKLFKKLGEDKIKEVSNTDMC